MTKEEIIKFIEKELIIYLKSGKLSINPYLKDLNFNIDNLEKLLKIHFLLDEEVLSYIKSLKINIKRLNTSIAKEEILTKGNIRGNILWHKSIIKRYNINPKDCSIFICKENFKNHIAKENIVLNELLKILYEIVTETSDLIYDNYDLDKEVLLKNINVYKKNIYLSKIEEKYITDKMINSVINSRNKFYSQSAKLLKRYKKILNLNKEEVENLFKRTFIDILNDWTLFELYWVVRIIKENTKNAKLYILDDKNTKVAEWRDNENIYTIYHNSTGSNEISFKVDLEEISDIENIVINKRREIINETNNIAKKIFPNIRERYSKVFNGRPDILIEIRNINDKKLNKVVIGEVKYTKDTNNIIQGIKELLEYIKFIKYKQNNKYEYFSELDIDLEVEGLLLSDNLILKITDS
ncbi:hypothetical protein HMPREF1092_00239 [Clostridium thermobutyricum]|uniref:Uncharacterized protein n=1 Tax=Clostridium thermobutyricum TaxID=29372 RepID=N9XTL9_9CLOT|nr:hypothetical protein [Clostridium thermobutyricum]ENZ03053.1 hypothetical protein HMPREF1092_00239 [Clostridium thermobutyricum]